MIKAVIVEDEVGAQKVLQSLLSEYAPQVKILGVADCVAEGKKLIRDVLPELVFMDIRMPDGDGFEVLDACKDIDFEVIFTTAYGDYREQAFDNFALHYLTKPIDIDKLEEAIARYEQRNGNAYTPDKYDLLKQLLASGQKKLALPVNDGYALVDTADITHCEAQSNYTKIYMKEGKTYLTSKSLKYYDERLTPMGFYRIHKSHLVNTAFLKEVKSDGYVVLEDGMTLTISQRAKRGFLKYLEGQA